MGDGEHTADGESWFDAGQREREAHYPAVGFALVEIDLMRAPGEALATLSRTLYLSEFTIPPSSDLTDYVVYDADGHAYSRADLLDDPGEDDVTPADALADALETGDVRERRLALSHLVELAETAPEECLDLVPLLTTQLRADPPDVQAMALRVVASVGSEYPAQVTPAIDAVIDVLDPERDPEVQADAIRVVDAVSEHDPRVVVDAAPRLAALLEDDPPVPGTLLAALTRIAGVDPDAVAPLVPTLLGLIEEGDEQRRIGALSIVGMVAKEYPNVAESSIPVLVELLDAEPYKVRGNAAGTLAELADQYPGELRSVVPRCIELLDDDYEKNRYNATSILAHIAKEYPGDVEPAIDPLIEILETEDFAYSRSNACWALGYMAAAAALETLEELVADDHHEEVRDAAAFAIHEIERG